jgi:hypothetical protein
MPKRPTFEEQAARPAAPQLPLVKREQAALPLAASALNTATFRVNELEEAIRFLLARNGGGAARGRADWIAMQKCRALVGIKG